MSKNRSDTPRTFKQLKARKSRKAVEKAPYVTVELCRVWHKRDRRVVPGIRHILGGVEYTVVEVPVSLDVVTEPPPIDTENLGRHRAKIQGRISGSIKEGQYHRFHALRYLPKVSQRISYRRIRRGEDLPTNVFGTDTRYIFNDTSFPWCTTGRVETPNGTSAGCMIGRNLLLTCSHAIQWNSDGTAGWVKFSPAYFDGVRPAFGSAWGTRVVFWNKASGGLSDKETAFDYVVVVLDRNLGDVTGYPGYRTYDKSWNNGSYWQHIGYPGDLTSGQRPAFFGSGAFASASNESVSGQTGYVMGHFMDITPGHSGGPYWGWWENEPWPRVVGVQSAEASKPEYTTSGDNEAGGGPAFSKLISYARSNY